MANIEFSLNWKTQNVSHTDKFYGQNVNFWRDCFPPSLHKTLMQVTTDDRFELEIQNGEMIEPNQEQKIFSIKPSQFMGNFPGGHPLIPRKGRYYPKGFLNGLANIFPGNVEPFRFRAVEKDRFVVDFNHPLAGKDMTLSLWIREMWKKDREKGGTCYDWIETITTGPGMQARINGEVTDFQDSHGYVRQDETADGNFYQEPRMVHHVDQTARKVIQDLYSLILEPGMKVLDLMGSWDSHISVDQDFESLIGLGLNRQELAANPQLSEYHVLDLNQTQSLPFEKDTFDVVICTNSVEYLVDPMTAFQMVARVLKPDGVFAITFSNRWFPPKVTRLWTELHEFERLGLVSEYFLQSNLFQEVKTYSMRGLPRPFDDKYYPELRNADPVYAVWATKKS